ncbi:hypothetical protein F383_22666 [Gossypium arboreum]|uniref:Uncharacterized protein n=1 Tax=Gossypium arboreum TaxID=29729 RepID=A0A0B0NXM2_GOSAR|nr:hypothetical protein F383_22666 [Gossypium arboreum]
MPYPRYGLTWDLILMPIAQLWSYMILISMPYPRHGLTQNLITMSYPRYGLTRKLITLMS